MDQNTQAISKVKMIASHLDDIAQALPSPSWASLYARLCNVIVRAEHRVHEQELPIEDWWDLFIGGAGSAEWTDITYSGVED